jgi:tRNA pseudouridine55 synthase
MSASQNPSLESTTSPSGLLIIDKPIGWTSFDVVAKVRGVLKTKKVGHAGTLDPMATGVLIILVGTATKLSNHLLSQDKVYQATILFGQQTDTGDADGKVIDTDDASWLTKADLLKILPLLEGTHDQMVPSYSAVKVKGQKLYHLARAGTPLQDRPIRTITISKLRLDSFTPAASANYPQAIVTVYCSKGTYIRVLAEEIAEKLGTTAHLIALRRLASGHYHLDQAISLDTLIQAKQPQTYLMPSPQTQK